MNKIYPESKVEIQGFMARHYDGLLNLVTFGKYESFIRSAIRRLHLKEDEAVLDLGCGTGKNACLMRRYLSENGYILGLDISEEMGAQFRKNCSRFANVEFRAQRIDVPFELDRPFDRAFISFVIHGFPHEVRLKIIQNVHRNLKPGGLFSILDFGYFKVKEMPFYYRIPFTTVECPYAFDFVERDWKAILKEQGFSFAEEYFWFKNYARLLTVKKD